jgi:hypothetical protein
MVAPTSGSLAVLFTDPLIPDVVIWANNIVPANIKKATRKAVLLSIKN